MARIGHQCAVAVCGQISQYKLGEVETGPRWLTQLIVRQARWKASGKPVRPRFDDDCATIDVVEGGAPGVSRGRVDGWRMRRGRL